MITQNFTHYVSFNTVSCLIILNVYTSITTNLTLYRLKKEMAEVQLLTDYSIRVYQSYFAI